MVPLDSTVLIGISQQDRKTQTIGFRIFMVIAGGAHSRRTYAPTAILHACRSDTPHTGERKELHGSTKLQLTIAILVKEGEGLLEFSNLFFGKLISHCVLLLLRM